MMIGVGVLAALLLAFHFSLPRFINSEAMQRRIKDAVAEQTGGVLEFQQIRVSVLPLPHVGIRKVAFSIPGRLGGTIEAISAYPEWRSLLTGKIRLSRIRVKEPRFRIDLSKAGEAGTDQEAPRPSIKERVSSLAVPVPPAVQGLSGKIDNGSIELTEAGKPVLSFQGIDLKLELDPAQVSFQLNAGSSLWKKMSAKGTFDPSKIKGKGHVDFVGFRPEALAGLLSPESARTLSEAEVNGRLSFEVDGPEHFMAEIVGSLPRLVLSHKGRSVNASARKLEAVFQVEKDRTTLSLTRLILDQPSADASGELRWEHAPPSVHLNLEGKNIDLSSAKEAVPAFTQGVPRIKEICDAVKDGELVTASYQAQGGSFRDLWKIGNMRIEGVIEKGRAALPKSGLEVTHIGGRVGISDGVFCAENFTARVGKSRVTGGRLEVNLSEPGIPYIIDISVDADLGELRPELMRHVDDGTLKKELSRITKLEGKTKVKIGVRKAGGPVEMKLEASGFRLVGNHGEVPYPIEIDGARFLLNRSRAEVGNVNVKVGRSTVSRLSGRLETKKDLQAKLTSGRSRINLEEIFSWLSKYDGVKEALQPIASLKGHV
ncbi:MAG: AsmA family protein, partial [Deltaproteobacteria bacterium]|nr:AsmA family protein [Deltaproteobacteria bacterium]